MITVGSTGLTEYTSKNYRIKTVIGNISSKTRASYYPGELSISIKLLIEKESERIVEGEIVEGEDVTQHKILSSLAIQNEIIAEDLTKEDA